MDSCPKYLWCDKELDVEMKSVNENYFKSSLENFQKSEAATGGVLQENVFLEILNNW